MRNSLHPLVLWTPRVLGIGVAVFIGVFALDAFSPGKPVWSAVVDFALHLTPALLLLATVAASWRRPWIGAAVFASVALLYATRVSRLDWVLLISGPLLLVGLLFLGAWRLQSTGSPR